MIPPKSVLDPAFVYTPAAETDISKTFARARRPACFECPFCNTVYAIARSDAGDGSDIACCGKVGECTPYTGELE